MRGAGRKRQPIKQTSQKKEKSSENITSWILKVLSAIPTHSLYPTLFYACGEEYVCVCTYMQDLNTRDVVPS
jgi:hypothetical protein